jgi:hypothetical protein
VGKSVDRDDVVFLTTSGERGRRKQRHAKDPQEAAGGGAPEAAGHRQRARAGHPQDRGHGPEPRGHGRVGTIERSGGVLQVTYDSHPLNTYIGDSAQGQAHGNDRLVAMAGSAK